MQSPLTIHHTHHSSNKILNCKDIFRKFLSCYSLCRTDQARTLTVPILAKILLLAESAAGWCRISDESLWSLAHDLHIERPPRINISSSPDALDHTLCTDSSSSTAGHAREKLRNILLIEIMVNPWTPAPVLQEAWLCALSHLKSSHGSGEFTLETDIISLLRHRQWKLGGPTSSLPDSDYGAATFNDASKKMSSFDLAMIEFGYRLHPDAISKRVSARHMLPNIAICISENTKRKENGLALLKESIFSTLNRFLPNTNILDFVEIVAIMSLFPADSLLFGCLASQSIFEQDRISATEDRTGIPVVPLLQEWILSQRLPDSTCVIWRLHPWLVASLCTVHLTIFTAYIDHLSKTLVYIQTCMSITTPCEQSDNDWSGIAATTRIQLLLIWKYVSDSKKQVLAATIHPFSSGQGDDQLASSRNFWNRFFAFF
ncbi:hypothetical protein BASA62_004776 [Batrachochytrium salamandrivorans]|nr:hypothetical protein BASA62_004776 [Batrachochytrium salamandrivorans]